MEFIIKKSREMLARARREDVTRRRNRRRGRLRYRYPGAAVRSHRLAGAGIRNLAGDVGFEWD